MTPEELQIAIRLGVAALGGLMVGIEREWSGAKDGHPQRFAGVRTFLLLALIGGIAATFQELGHIGAGVTLLAATGLLCVVAYGLRALRGEIESTTEVAAVLTVGGGFVAGLGLLHVSIAVFAATALVLVEKGTLHGLVQRIPSETLEAAARFAVLSLVILPLLPQGPYGPEPGFRPQEIWALVLIFSGLSFAGYMALRVVGPHRGYGVAGLLGGLISSTAVTLTYARQSREKESLGSALALGVLGANCVMYLRVLTVSSLLSRTLGLHLLPLLALPFVVGLLTTALVYRLQGRNSSEVELPKSPLGLTSSLQMAVLFQLVLYGVYYARELFGNAGLLATAALLGLTNVDALTISMVKMAASGSAYELAARALCVGVLSNTLLKLTLTVLVGKGAFRRTVAGGLAGLAVSGALALVLI